MLNKISNFYTTYRGAYTVLSYGKNGIIISVDTFHMHMAKARSSQSLLLPFWYNSREIYIHEGTTRLKVKSIH